MVNLVYNFASLTKEEVQQKQDNFDNFQAEKEAQKLEAAKAKAEADAKKVAEEKAKLEVKPSNDEKKED